VLSVRKTEGRTSGFEPEPRGSRPRMLPLHHGHHVGGDDRTRTGACSPDKRVLLPLSYVPLHGAGGIRTHDLELMRLARTASPLRRESARLESNQRSPAPKAGGVPNSPTGRRSRRLGGRRAWLPSNGAARCSERFPLPSVARRHACQPPSWTAREMHSPLSDAGCTLRPTHRLSVSRCSVTPLDRPSTVQFDQHPRRDSNPQLPD
jgi:hypothetical protein